MWAGRCKTPSRCRPSRRSGSRWQRAPGSGWRRGRRPRHACAPGWACAGTGARGPRSARWGRADWRAANAGEGGGADEDRGGWVCGTPRAGAAVWITAMSVRAAVQLGASSTKTPCVSPTVRLEGCASAVMPGRSNTPAVWTGTQHSDGYAHAGRGVREEGGAGHADGPAESKSSMSSAHVTNTWWAAGRRDRCQTQSGVLLRGLEATRRTPGAIRAGTPMYMTSLTYSMSRKSPSAFARPCMHGSGACVRAVGRLHA